MKTALTPVPGRIILSEEDIQQRVAELGATISRDCAGQKLHLLAVLRGAIPFMADLSRNLGLDVTFDYLAVTRTANGQVRLIKDLDTPVEGRSILLVEDIVNEGETLHYLLKTLQLRKPKDIKICTMFDRPAKRVQPIKLDYVGATISDTFVVGYGLDYHQLYRNLPYLAELNLLK